MVRQFQRCNDRGGAEIARLRWRPRFNPRLRTTAIHRIALLTDDLTKIVFARAIARRAYRTVEENLFVGVVHVPGITAAPIGLIGPVQAAIIHLGPDVLMFQTSTSPLGDHIDTAPMRANASAANAAWLTPLRGAPARCGGNDTPQW